MKYEPPGKAPYWFAALPAGCRFASPHKTRRNTRTREWARRFKVSGRRTCYATSGCCARKPRVS